jgi:cell division protein ZapB
MDADLKALEEKVARLIALCLSLRDENVQLRQELAQAQDDTRQLRENMTLATTKLEALIDRLPLNAMSKETL